MELSGKTAVVTGAGGGLGGRVVRLLKKNGVKLVLVEKEKSFLESIKDILDGNDSFIYECDMSKPQKVEQVANEIVANFDKIDILLNIAGVGIYKQIQDLTMDDWFGSMNINLNAPFIMTKILLKSLKRAEKAVVISIGSGMGTIPTAGRSAYCSSKFGLRGLSLTLSKEFAGTNVSFSLMTLGSIMTNFGTGGLAERKKLEEEGKKYLEPDFVAQEIINVIKSDSRKDEHTIYPEGYGEKL